MIDNLKKIILKEIEQDIDEYNNAQVELNKVDRRIEEIEIILSGDIKKGFGEDTNESIVLKEPAKPNFIAKKFSFLQKHILNRKQYLFVESHNKQLQDRYERELEEYKKKYDSLELELKELELEKEKLVKICESKEKFNQRFELIKNAKTLKDLNLTLEEAQRILTENGEKFVLEDCDKIIIRNNSEFDSENDFILVHKTIYSPTENFVRSQLASGATEEATVYFMGDEFTMEYSKAMDTVHFCQNGEVASHPYGNFDKRKYAILIPFATVSKKNLRCFNPEDTYFVGSVSTQNGYILCPESEIEKLKKLNPNTTIIGYKGESVDGYADAFLSMLGYKQEPVAMHSWSSDIDMKKHSKFMEKNSKYHYGYHAGSIENYIADLINSYNKIIGFARSLKKYIDSGKKYDITTLIYEIFNYNNKTKIKSGIQEKEFQKNIRIAPSITDVLSRGIYTQIKPHQNMLLQDYIDESYNNDKSNSKLSNLDFLKFKLKKDFDIDISTETINLLNENEDQEIESFCNLIANQNLRELVLKMFNDRIINKLSDAKDVVFMYSIVDQLYKKNEFERDGNAKKI